MNQRKMPAQRPHRSKQTYETPWPFIRACETRFGPIAWDLAAGVNNAKAPRYLTRRDNSLTFAWHKLRPKGWLFLNPPYSAKGFPISAWVRKCRDEMLLGARILFLIPASIAAEYCDEYIRPHAYTLPLRPRLSFDGKGPYPKDLMLCVFAHGLNGVAERAWDHTQPWPPPLLVDSRGRPLACAA